MPEATVDINAPAPGAAAPGAGTFLIPDAYKDKPYLKDVDNPEKLFKLLDGAQTLIGQRPAGIPGPDAAPEEWAKFYDAVGRPKTAAEYQFEVDPKIKTDEKVVGDIKEILYRHGLTAAQGKGVQKDIDALFTKIAQDRGVAVQLENTNFDKLAADTFGADRDKILATSKALLEAHTPAAMKGELAKLSNENLIIMAGVLNNLSSKYIKADGAPPAPGGSGSTPDDLRAQARVLMAEQAKLSPVDIRYTEMQNQINELYRRASGGK